jgi:hypothetical protein
MNEMDTLPCEHHGHGQLQSPGAQSVRNQQLGMQVVTRVDKHNELQHDCSRQMPHHHALPLVLSHLQGLDRLQTQEPPGKVVCSALTHLQTNIHAEYDNM